MWTTEVSRTVSGQWCEVSRDASFNIIRSNIKRTSLPITWTHLHGTLWAASCASSRPLITLSILSWNRKFGGLGFRLLTVNILQSFPVVLNIFKVSFFPSVVYFFIRRPSATDLGLFILTEVFMVYFILFGLLTDHNRNIILHVHTAAESRWR